jgi:uncharacterized FlgJ-related protein
LTDSLLLENIKQLKIRYPKIVLSQIKLETGCYTSRLCKSQHNLFGMTYPNFRESTAIGIKNNYCIYKNWYDSLRDYKLYQDKFIQNINSKEQYYNHLRRYASDKLYIKQLKQYESI